MNRILTEMIIIEFLSYGVKPRYMELPVWMLLLKFIVDRRSVHILHRNKHKVKLLRKLLINILCQKFLKQDKRRVRTGHFIGMMSRVDNLAWTST